MSRSLDARRAAWTHRGAERPPFAIEPGPDQESVWDYPRPPALVEESRVVQVRLGDQLLAETRAALRVLETASPPTVYIPPADVEWSFFRQAPGSSHCEWKGAARYWDAQSGERLVSQAGWSYPSPYPEFERLADHLAVYPGRLSCSLGGVAVSPQAGDFYGGWVTPDVIGPFKGEPGTGGW